MPQVGRRETRPVLDARALVAQRKVEPLGIAVRARPRVAALELPTAVESPHDVERVALFARVVQVADVEHFAPAGIVHEPVAGRRTGFVVQVGPTELIAEVAPDDAERDARLGRDLALDAERPLRLARCSEVAVELLDVERPGIRRRELDVDGRRLALDQCQRRMQFGAPAADRRKQFGLAVIPRIPGDAEHR